MRRINIIQGEHCVVSEPDTMVTTLLGSCIAVCLNDSVSRVGGMNHFLLGEPGADVKPRPDEMQRYGVHAMELLINGMMAKGASRARLKGHIYGGANIIAGLGSIGSQNADFARRFLETEGIQIGHIDIGGRSARKIEFIPYQGLSRSKYVSDDVPLVRTPAPVLAPQSDGELELF